MIKDPERLLKELNENHRKGIKNLKWEDGFKLGLFYNKCQYDLYYFTIMEYRNKSRNIRYVVRASLRKEQEIPFLIRRTKKNLGWADVSKYYYLDEFKTIEESENCAELYLIEIIQKGDDNLFVKPFHKFISISEYNEPNYREIKIPVKNGVLKVYEVI